MVKLKKELSILVGSCDSYSYLWEEFSLLFNKYWDYSMNVDKFILSETKATDIEGFNFLTPGKLSYSECVIYALNKIKTPYVLWLQDDYFFRRTIDKNQFEFYIRYIKDNNIDRFGICEDSRHYSKHKIESNIWKFNQNSNYTISMQASIWNVDFFKSCLKPKESPWVFEIDGSKRLNSRNHNIYFEAQNPPWYLEAVRKGKYTKWYYNIKKEENL